MNNRLKSLVYAPVLATVCLFVTLTAIALPDAAQKVKVGQLLSESGGCESLRATPVSTALGRLPQRAPDFTLKDHQGRDYQLSALRGHVVLVNFWATWCKTCTIEMPALDELAHRMAERQRKFRLVAISVDEDWPTVRKFFEKDPAFDVLLDPSRAVAKLYGTEKFPETFVIDREGNVRYFIVADRNWAQPDIVGCLDSLIGD